MMKVPLSGSWRPMNSRIGSAATFLRTKEKTTTTRGDFHFFSTTGVLSKQQQAHGTPPSIQLFKYAICPFCNQVKAALDFIKLDYSTVEVNPLTKAEISWSSDYRKVPIAILEERDDDQKQKTILKGSDDIVAALLQHPSTIASWPNIVMALQTKTSQSSSKDTAALLSMQEFSSSPSALYWIRFAKDDLSSLLYPNLCPTLSDSYRAFGYVDHVATFGAFQKFAIKSVGSFAMYMAASRVKRKRNITDAQEALRQALITLEVDGLGQGNKDFVSGEALPNLGDVTLFGTLRSLEGLPVHSRVLDHGDGSVKAWYGRMKKFM